MTTKTSILVFYLSLSKTQKLFRWLTIGTLAIVNIAGAALTFLNVFQCRPVSAAFDMDPPANAKCMDILTIYLSSSPVNISTDLAIMFLPIPILTSMRLPKKQKIILIITFGFGVFVAAVDVIRIAYLQSAVLSRFKDVTADQHSSRTSEQGDFSWYASLTYMWSAIEVNVGIMCGCVPGLKPLVSKFLPNLIRDVVGDAVRSLSSSDHRDSADAARTPSMPTTPTRAKLCSPDSASSKNSEPVDMLDFLTTPDMANLPAFAQDQDAATSPLHRTLTASNFFDFVNTKRRKSMLYMTNRESLFPTIMVTFLFLIWGFAYGLLDALNTQFQLVARMSTGMTVGLHSAYYVGYFIGPLTFGRLVFKYWGFKACYTVGLAIYAVGTLVFWPASVLTSFGAFVVSNFIVGLGLSTLEISANTFITLCGPEEYGEIRLNLSQGVQAIGTLCAPLLAAKVLFRNQDSAPSLLDVQWTYLGIALVMVLFALAYHYLPLPEATDSELADIAERSDNANDAAIELQLSASTSVKVKILYITLALAVFSQFCYVGGQESINTSFAAYIKTVYPSLNAVNHQAIGHTAFAVGRFFAAFVGFFVKPRYIFLACYLCTIAFSVLCMNFSGAAPATLVIILYLFEGPLFPLVFSTGIRGMGANTKNASVLLTAAISGGAVFPPVMYTVQRSRGAQYAYCVIVAAFAAGAVLPAWVVGNSKARKQSDYSEDERILRQHTRQNQGRRVSLGFGIHGGSSGKGTKRWGEKIKLWNRKSISEGTDGNVEHREERRPSTIYGPS